jgi:hypothetical protein
MTALMKINPGEHRCRFQESNTRGLAAGGRLKSHGLAPVLGSDEWTVEIRT